MVVEKFNLDEHDIAVFDYICARYQCDYDTALKILLGFYYNQLTLNQKKVVRING